MLPNTAPDQRRRAHPGLCIALRATVGLSALVTAWVLLGGPLPFAP